MSGQGDPSAARTIAQHSELLLDALARAVVLTDLDGIIVGWNGRAERFYGWTADEAIGQSLFELLAPPTMQEAGRRIMAEVLGGTNWQGEVRVLRRDHDAALTFSFLAPLRDSAGRVIGAIAAADDLTDVQRLERHSADLGEHLQLALAAGRLGTWRWDMATGATTWDSMMERNVGLEPGQFDGTYDAWVATVHPDDVERTLAVLHHAVDAKQPYETEHRVIWPDGTVHWLEGRGTVTFDDAGNVTGTIGVTADVTERKLLEANAARRMHEAERQAGRERLQRERLEFLAELNDLARAATDHFDLMERVTAAAVPKLGDWCSIHFLPGIGTVPETRVAHADPSRIEWARGLQDRYPYDPRALAGVPAVIRSGTTEFIRELDDSFIQAAVQAAPRRIDEGELQSILDVLQLTSVITVPLTTKRGVVGAMQFVSAESRRVYDDDDVSLAEAAAGRVAEALDNAWLTEQQRTIAGTLQAALLPTRLPEVPGLDISVRYWAAGAVAEVGGDFYDVFPIEEGRWAVVIGDVCGNGATAAAVTAVARHTIRAAATHGITHESVLEWVNSAIHSGGSGLFCTVLYSTVERLPDGAWLLTSVAGGHPSPVLVAADGSASMVGTHGTLIGALPAIRVTTTSTRLERGSTVVLYTDGVTDVHPPHALDDESLRAIVSDAARRGATADEVAEALGRAIEEILPIPIRNDDVALVVLRVT